MVKRLKRISPLQMGKFLGIFYALFSLLIIPFFILGAVVSAFAPHSHGGNLQAGIGLGVGLILAVLAPIFYGFIFGALGALLYNLIASWVGGIEFEIE
jgi:hypothetical protein